MDIKKSVRGIKSRLPESRKVTLLLVLALLGGIFGLAYATTSGVAVLRPPGSAPDIGRVIDLTTDNENIGPNYTHPTFPDNIIGGTGGKIDNGNLFFIWPRAPVNTGLWIQIELVNREEINKKFTSLTENFAVYQTNDTNPANWENNQESGDWTKIIHTENTYLTLIGAPATFKIPSTYVDNDYPLVVALESGDYYAKENYDSYPNIVNYLSIEEAGY